MKATAAKAAKAAAIADARATAAAKESRTASPGSKRGPWTVTLRLTGRDAPSSAVATGEGPKLKQAKAVAADVLLRRAREMGARAPKVGRPRTVYTQLTATEQDDARPYYGATRI